MVKLSTCSILSETASPRDVVARGRGLAYLYSVWDIECHVAVKPEIEN